jgi:hypothetical protein
MRKQSKFLYLIYYLGFCVGIYLLYVLWINHVDILVFQDFNIFKSNMLIFVLLLFCFWSSQIYLFFNIFKRFESVQAFETSILYILGGIFSYIPGKIPGFLLLEFIANRFKIKLFKTTSVILYFQLLSIASSFTIVILYWKTFNIRIVKNICYNVLIPCDNFLAIISCFVCIIALVLFCIRKRLTFYFAKLFKIFLFHTAIYCVSWHLLTGAAYALFLIVSTESNLAYSEFILSFVLSYTLAQIMIVFPAGLGAFEILFVNIFPDSSGNVGAFLILYRGLVLGIQILLSIVLITLFAWSNRLRKINVNNDR